MLLVAILLVGWVTAVSTPVQGEIGVLRGSSQLLRPGSGLVLAELDKGLRVEVIRT